MSSLRFIRALAACAILCVTASAADAATIIKLDLNGTGPDVSYSGGASGVFETVDDNPVGLIGDQATTIVFTDFLSSLPATTGSYSLSGVTSTGLPGNVGSSGILANPMSGGSFQLYDSANVLLLDVNLDDSALLGSVSGALFNLTSGTVVGGLPALISQLGSNSIGMSMALTNISGGGMTRGGDQSLNAFTADAVKEISATQVPEPSTMLLALGSTVALTRRRRRHASHS